jgi:hypothetical protein
MEKQGANRLYFLSMGAAYILSAICVVVVMMRHWRSSEIFYVREQGMTGVLAEESPLSETP